MSRLRIGYARIFQETCAFSPVLTELDNFRDMHWLEGAELAAAASPEGAEYPGLLANAEVSGFVRAAEEDGDVEAVPLFSVATLPGGPVSDVAFDHLTEKLAEAIGGAGALDGLFLSLHGAMAGEGGKELDGVLLERVRAKVGAGLPVGVSLDLHGHLTPQKINPTPLLFGYHTNPHRDLASTGRRAGRGLIRTLRGDAQPTRAWRKLPVALGGGMNVDLLAPMRSLYTRVWAWQRHPKVLSSDAYQCHPYLAASDAGWAIHVLTDNDQALAEHVADDLAHVAWKVAKTPPPPFRSVDEALEEARSARLARRTGVVSFIDGSDIIGCGGPGCNTHMITELAGKTRGLVVYLPVLDPRAAQELADKAVGTSVSAKLGGTHGPEFDPETSLSGKLIAAQNTLYGATAVVDTGDIKIIVTEKPPFMISPQLYKELGLPPLNADIVVQKSIFRYLVYWWWLSRKQIPVNTQGATDLARIGRTPGLQPVLPFADVSEWQSRDQAYRDRDAS